VNSIGITHDGFGSLRAEKLFKIGSVWRGNGFGIKEEQVRISYPQTLLMLIAVDFQPILVIIVNCHTIFAGLSMNLALCPYVDFIISASVRTRRAGNIVLAHFYILCPSKISFHESSGIRDVISLRIVQLSPLIFHDSNT
jgi:hypothetical protein